MRTVGIVIDSWKLSVFRKHLDAGGFSYTENPGLTKDTMLLKVKTDNVVGLTPFVNKANAECKKP